MEEFTNLKFLWPAAPCLTARIWRNTLCNMPVVAAHLHPKIWLSLQGSTVLSKVDGFQSSLTKAYKVAALEVRALTATSLLMEYQVKLEEELTASPNPDLWVEVSIMTSLCLHLHKMVIQSEGRAMGWMDPAGESLLAESQFLVDLLTPQILISPPGSTQGIRSKKPVAEILLVTNCGTQTDCLKWQTISVPEGLMFAGDSELWSSYSVQRKTHLAEWRLYPSLFWEWYGQLLKTSLRWVTTRPLSFSLYNQSVPLEVDTLAHQWLCVLVYAFTPIALISRS